MSWKLRLSDPLTALLASAIFSAVLLVAPLPLGVRFALLILPPITFGIFFRRPATSPGSTEDELSGQKVPALEEASLLEVSIPLDTGQNPRGQNVKLAKDISGVESVLSSLVANLKSAWNSQNVPAFREKNTHQDDGRNLELVTLKASSDFISENVMRAFEISDNLANTAKTAFELSEKVQNGVKIVTGSLADSLSQTAVLFEQSKQISKIIEIMSEISEKIHILSINASIVSARAGTAGKGFEVVAKEIRLLAKETEKSLEEIEQVILAVQETIKTVVSKVDTASKQTNNEQQSMMSVAGALQGVILAVEIIRAVTSVAKEKAEEQKSTMETWLLETDSQELTELESIEENEIPEYIFQIDQELVILKSLISHYEENKENP